MSTQDILQNYSNILSVDDWVTRGIREFGWMIIKFLASIVDSVSNVTDQLFKLDIFYNNKNVAAFIDSFKPVIIVLFAISFCIIGYQIMYRKKEYKQIAINLFVALVVIIILPSAMNKLNDLTNVGVSAVTGKPKDMTNEIIKANITDVLLYDKANFDKNAISQFTSPNQIDKSNIRYINPVAIIEPDFFNSMHIQNQDVFKNQIDLTEEGNVTTSQLNQGWLTFLKNYYYRYSINFFTIIVALFLVGATMIFTCVKLAMLIYELAFDKLLAMLSAAADVSDGRKTKQIVENIIYTYIVTFLIAVLLKFYVLFITAVSNTTGLTWLVLMIGGSIATINGPSIVGKIFGINAGMSNGLEAIMGTYMLGKTITGIGKKLGNGIRNIAGVGSMAAGTAVGGAMGTIDGIRKASQNQSDPKGGNDKMYNDISDKGNNAKNNNMVDSLYGDVNEYKPKETAKENMDDKNNKNLQSQYGDENGNIADKIDYDSYESSGLNDDDKNNGNINGIYGNDSSYNSKSKSSSAAGINNELGTSNGKKIDSMYGNLNGDESMAAGLPSDEQNNNNIDKIYGNDMGDNLSENGINSEAGTLDAESNKNIDGIYGNMPGETSKNKPKTDINTAANLNTDEVGNKNNEGNYFTQAIYGDGTTANISADKQVDSSDMYQDSKEKGTEAKKSLYSDTMQPGQNESNSISANIGHEDQNNKNLNSMYGDFNNNENEGTSIGVQGEKRNLYRNEDKSGSESTNNVVPDVTMDDQNSKSVNDLYSYSSENVKQPLSGGIRTSIQNDNSGNVKRNVNQNINKNDNYSQPQHTVHSTEEKNESASNQTIGQYAKGFVKKKVQDSKVYKQTAKSYDIAKNTTMDLMKDHNENGK